MRGRDALAALAVFVLALGLRLAVTQRPAAGAPEVVPFDDLYHAKRIVGAALGGGVIDFDPARGPRGAFCPWPPLYDGAAALVARAAGAGTPAEVLRVVRWIPPLVASLLPAVLFLVAARRLGALPALTLALAVALATSFLEDSRFGALDHHFLEPPLVLSIALGTAACAAAGETNTARRGLGLGLAMAAGLLVQPALLVACGIAAAALLAFPARGGAPARAGALAFGTTAAVVGIYRLTRPADLPESSWYLGVPHLAALASAALALALAALLLGRRLPPPRVRLLSAAAGGAILAAVPAAARTFLGGARFFGGDPWLDTIVEFRPLLSSGRTPWDALGFLGGGALLLPVFLARGAKGGPARRVAALFGTVYLVLAFARFRFAVPALPFVSLCGALVVADLAREGRRRLASAAAALVVLPAAAGALSMLVHPEPIVLPEAHAPLRAARLLRASAAPGRVLAPWSWGHLFDVAGGRAVILDNFGSSIGEPDFDAAVGALLSTREVRLADYCRRTGVRFLVFEDPLFRLPEAAASIGLARGLYLKGGAAGAPPRVTRLAQATIWWRAYFDRGRARPERGLAGAPLRLFVPEYEDPERTWEPEPYRGPALVVWRFVGP